MDTNMKDIITNLKFISNLQKHDKINTRYMFKEPVGFLTSFSRTFFYNDNRKNALKFIESTINNGFDLLTYYERLEKLSDRAICLNIVQDLLQSKVGLENLKETYSSDLQFVCNIDTIIQTIDAKMKDVESKYNDVIKQSKNNQILIQLAHNLDTNAHNLDYEVPSFTQHACNSDLPLIENTDINEKDSIKGSTKSCATVATISPPYYSLTEPEFHSPKQEELRHTNLEEEDNFQVDEEKKHENKESKGSVILPLLTSNCKNRASPLSRMVKEKNTKKT